MYFPLAYQRNSLVQELINLTTFNKRKLDGILLKA